MNSEQSTSSHEPVANQTPVAESAAADGNQPPANSETSSLDAGSSGTGRTDTETRPVVAGSAKEPPRAAAATEVTGASQPADPPAEASPPAAEVPAAAGTADSAEAEPAVRPRVKLNPTFDPARAVAIPSPSLADSRPSTQAAETEPTGDETAAMAEAQSVQSSTPPPAAPAAPVALPPANVDLDADVEAELAAALSEEKVAETPTVVSSEEGTTEPITEEDIEPGTKLKGRVQSIQKDSILLDVGFRSSAMVQLRQFDGRKQPQLGQELEIVVDRFDADDGLLLASLPRMARAAGNWDEVAVGQVVDCLVKKSNKGGLEVTVSNLRAFMPASQVDLGFVASLDEYVGQKLTVKIIEVKPEKRNLVVSRRALMLDERQEVAQDMWKTLEVGQTHSGTVKTVKDYGAFVDIGGIDGLLHVAEMSWTRVNHPRDILKVGQQLEVQLISVDAEKKKVSLSLKQLKKNPWEDCVQRYPVESVVQGKVSNITNFGAFIEIEEGVEGLIHISEIDYRRINKVTDVLKEGQEVEAKVVSIDVERKRIGLSMKALKAKPEPVQKPKDEDLAPSGGEAYQRKHKGPLKGGTGGTSGPLFG